jgi:hypothetical protein
MKLKLLAEPQNRRNFLIRGFKTENPPAEVADGFVEDRPLRTVSTDQQISGNNLEAVDYFSDVSSAETSGVGGKSLTLKKST